METSLYELTTFFLLFYDSYNPFESYSVLVFEDFESYSEIV